MKKNIPKFEKFIINKFILDIKKVKFEDILTKTNPIIFDTNFLFIIFQFKIDIIEQIKNLIGNKYSLYIYSGTINELVNLEKKKTKNKKFLPLIVKMLHLYNFKIITTNKLYIDEQILDNLNKKVLIATNDKKLRKNIAIKGFKVMYLRQFSFLEIK